MIWGFISSLIVLGVGCGLIFVGTLSFDIVENDKSLLKTVTEEYDMKNDLLIDPYIDYEIEYIKTDNNNIKVEFSINKYYSISEHFWGYYDNTIMSWAYSCDNPIKLIGEFIITANEKKLVSANNIIDKITIYTNEENIKTLKNNLSKYIDEKEKDELLEQQKEFDMSEE